MQAGGALCGPVPAAGHFRPAARISAALSCVGWGSSGFTKKLAVEDAGGTGHRTGHEGPTLSTGEWTSRGPLPCHTQTLLRSERGCVDRDCPAPTGRQLGQAETAAQRHLDPRTRGAERLPHGSTPLHLGTWTHGTQKDSWGGDSGRQEDKPERMIPRGDRSTETHLRTRVDMPAGTDTRGT